MYHEKQSTKKKKNTFFELSNLPTDVFDQIDKLIRRTFKITIDSHQLSQKPSFVKWLLVYHGENLIACCCIFLDINNLIYMNNLAVDDSYRRRQIGTFLLNYMRQMYSYFWFIVNTDNQVACKFYQKFGFKSQEVSHYEKRLLMFEFRSNNLRIENFKRDSKM